MEPEGQGPKEDRNPEGGGEQRPGERATESQKERGTDTQRKRGKGQRPRDKGGGGGLTWRSGPLILLTIHLPLRDLPKDLQVGPVEDAAQDIRETTVLGPKEPLSGHPVGNQPHAEEEEEEEHILHLQRRKMRPSLAPPFPTLARPSARSPSSSPDAQLPRIHDSFLAPPLSSSGPAHTSATPPLTILLTMTILGPSCLLTVKMCSSLSVKIMKSRQRTVRPRSYRPGVSLGCGETRQTSLKGYKVQRKPNTRLPNTRLKARMWPLQDQNWDTPHSGSPGVYSKFGTVTLPSWASQGAGTH